MKVLIARAPKPKNWTKFHNDPNCSGLRKGEDADGAQYVLRDLDDLPDNVKPCKFCFPGAERKADVNASGVLDSGPRLSKGVRVGHVVEFRDLVTAKSERWRIVSGPSTAPDELSAETPIAKGLLGHEPGEVVDIELRNGRVRRVEITAVSDSPTEDSGASRDVQREPDPDEATASGSALTAEWVEITTLDEFREAIAAGDRIVITDAVLGVEPRVHSPECSFVTEEYFVAKILRSGARDGRYYRARNTKIAEVHGAVRCGHCYG